MQTGTRDTKSVHFTILDVDDRVSDGFVGLRHYNSDLFVLMIASTAYSSLKQKVETALDSLKILIPKLQVEFYKLDLKDYWGIFFRIHELAREIARQQKNVRFYANIGTSNRIAAMAARDAFASIGNPTICYYFKRGKGPEEEGSEIVEIPVPPPFRDYEKTIPILKTLYEIGGRAESIEEITRRIGDKLSRSDNPLSQARLVEYYIRKLEVYAIVKTVSGRKCEVMLTGAPLAVQTIKVR